MTCLFSAKGEQVWVDDSNKVVYAQITDGVSRRSTVARASQKALKVIQAFYACLEYVQMAKRATGKQYAVLPILRESGFRKVMSLGLTPPE